MNKELLVEMENQGHLLETTRVEIEALKEGTSTYGGGQSLKMVCFHCGMLGPHKGWKKFCLWEDLSQAKTTEKGLHHVADALHGAGTTG
jgi:hypothetical protein